MATINKIRPAARLIRTIGQDLIKDVYAAIVELVKNSYDADSSNVLIRFHYNELKALLSIKIEDHGIGMSFNTVVNKWLVPATNDKLVRKTSDNGRALQGRKGIGRFAAGILGQQILLETSHNGSTTSLLLDMEELETTEYLDQVEINVEEKVTNLPNGTIINIETSGLSAEDVAAIWTSRQLRKLFIELRGLTAPDEIYQMAKEQGFDIRHDPFEIKLSFESFPISEYSQREIIITPFPVLDLYDYKISGKVDSQGRASLSFHNNNVKAVVEEFIIEIPLDLEKSESFPGDIFIDIRAYDRDPDNIENIILRGMKDPDSGQYLGKQEAKRVLDEYYGVGIYREQFKIRPYGDQSVDWLDLDKKRVQNPSFKIGHNQIIGFVYVRAEESSGLQEKSARDGLVENSAYFGLTTIVSKVINELEGRRFTYRRKSLRGGRSKTHENDVDDLFDFEKTKESISKELKNIGITESQQKIIESAVELALNLEAKKKTEYVRSIRETIAIYQGQANLGKITHVILHEGRKNIKYISETIPRILKWATQISKKYDEETAKTLQDRSEKVLTHTKGLSFLFNKIDPLARTKRLPAKNLNIKSEIENCFLIFQGEIDREKIIANINVQEPNISIMANEIDLITVFSNLIENSIFWMQYTNEKEKNITINVFKEDESVIVDFKDSGPGFQGGNLELMFEPGYSMKRNGLGLGLALAGNAMTRIGGTIEAKRADEGAIFEIIFKGKKNG